MQRLVTAGTPHVTGDKAKTEIEKAMVPARVCGGGANERRQI